MFENCKEPNDYIEEIFKLGLVENYSQIVNGSEIEGYYIGLPSRNKSDISKLRQWQRLFVNIKTKSKRVYGEMDTENTFSQCLMWAYEELSKVVTGQNPNFPIDKNIGALLTERENEIAPYILKCVDQKLKAYISSKRNPNYIVTQKNGKREYDKVEFYYLDDNKDADRYSILEDISTECETGELSDYLLEMLLRSDSLTEKQRQYIITVLSEDHYVSNSKVYNLDGEIVYNCNQYFFFNKQLAKKIRNIIDNNEGLVDTGSRIVFR